MKYVQGMEHMGGEYKAGEAFLASLSAWSRGESQSHLRRPCKLNPDELAALSQPRGMGHCYSQQ